MSNQNFNYALTQNQGNICVLFVLNMEQINILSETGRIHIPVHDPDNPTGIDYQRTLSDSRKLALSNDIKSGKCNGVFPSILCNYREGLNIDLNQPNGNIDLDDLRSITIIDGQHRVAAYADVYNTCDENFNTDDYHLVFQMYDKLPIDEEIKTYSDVNSKQKGINKKEAESYKDKLKINKIYSGELNWDDLKKNEKKKYVTEIVMERCNIDINNFMYKKINYENSIPTNSRYLITYGKALDSFYNRITSDMYKSDNEFYLKSFDEQSNEIVKIIKYSFDALLESVWGDSDIKNNPSNYKIENQYILRVFANVFFNIYQELISNDKEYNVENIKSFFNFLGSFDPEKIKKSEDTIKITGYDTAKELFVNGTYFDPEYKLVSGFDTFKRYHL